MMEPAELEGGGEKDSILFHALKKVQDCGTGRGKAEPPADLQSKTSDDYSTGRSEGLPPSHPTGKKKKQHNPPPAGARGN